MPDSTTTAVAMWRTRCKLSQRDAAAALGMSLKGYQEQERGRSFETGRSLTPSRTLLLACAAIEHGVAPIGSAQDAPGAALR